MVLSTVITSEEVNYLIYRYLLEAGFIHSAFTFGQESFVSQSEIRPADVAPGLLISVLQRGLQYSALEHHINEDGSERKCSKAFNLLQVHVCDEEEEKKSTTVDFGSPEGSAAVLSNNHGLSQGIDATLQSSLSTLNLALQNASIMATNAVYGANNTSINTGKTTNCSPVGTAQSSGNKKKKQKESKDSKTTSSSSTGTTTSASLGLGLVDVEMKESESSVVEIKTEEDSSASGRSSGQFVEEEIVELIGHQSEVIGCAWNPQKKNLLASASGDSTVRFWTFPASAVTLYEVNPRTVNKNVKVLEHVLIKESDRSYDVTCLEWRRDGGFLATGCYDGKARIWTAQGDLQKTLQRHTGPIFAVRWNINGKLLLTSGIDGLAIIWDVEGGGVRHLLQHHASTCLDADWRNETEFATSGSDKTVHFYDMSMAPAEGTGESFNPSCSLKGHTEEVNTVKFDPTGRFLATCSDDSSVRLWAFERDDAETSSWQGICLQVLTAHSKEVYTLRWSPIAGSGVFASASFDCSVRVWRISEDGREVTSMSLNGHTQPVYAIAFSPCGKYLASGSLDETMLIWDVQSGTVLKSYSASGQGGFFDLEWRDNWVAAGDSKGRVTVFEFNHEENENENENENICESKTENEGEEEKEETKPELSSEVSQSIIITETPLEQESLKDNAMID